MSLSFELSEALFDLLYRILESSKYVPSGINTVTTVLDVFLINIV